MTSSEFVDSAKKRIYAWYMCKWYMFDQSSYPEQMTVVDCTIDPVGDMECVIYVRQSNMQNRFFSVTYTKGETEKPWLITQYRVASMAREDAFYDDDACKT